MPAVHLEPAFYAAAGRVLGGSSLDRPIAIEEVALLAEETLGWQPKVMRLQELDRPVALADSASGRIAFSPSALLLRHVLHEIAHLMVGVEHGHDAVFVDAFCELVARFGSDQLAEQLRAATNGVTSRRDALGGYRCEMEEE